MLLDFQVANYRSFRAPARLNLAASNYDTKTLPGNIVTPRLPGISKQRFLRGAAIYGANASGKSNLIRAVFELQKLVRNSHTSEKGGGMPYNPFVLDEESPEEPTIYGIRFVASGVRYHYSLAFDRTRVLEESLSAFPKGREQLWYLRLWDEASDAYVYTPEESDHFTIRKTDVESTKANSLFLSTATNLLDHPKLGPVYAWFRETLNVVNLSIDGKPLNTGQTLERFRSAPKEVLHFLRRADLGIADMDVKTEKIPDDLPEKLPKSLADKAKDKDMTSVTMIHLGEAGQRYPIGLDDESSGTRRFFDLISPWIELIEGVKCCSWMN